MRWFIIPVLLLMMGCQPNRQRTDVFTILYNQIGSISSLDPAFGKNQANNWALLQLYNGLVQFDEQLNVQPSIAKKWEITDSGQTYIFHLRQDVFFHDHPFFSGGNGRTVTAGDVAYSFNRIIDPDVASPGSWIFRDKISGDRPFEARDDSTFVLHLTRPFLPMLGILCMTYCSVVPREIVEHYGVDFRAHPVGTGPFYMHSWEEGEALWLKKNPHYFERENGVQLPYADEVLVSFIDNKSVEFLSLLSGDLTFISDIDASFKDLVLTVDGDLQPRFEKDIQLIRAPFLNTEYLGIVVKDGILQEGHPLRDKRIRQAINYGFDRKKMMRFLRNNKGLPANKGMIPPGLPAYDSGADYGYRYDPLKAKSLLSAAGYPNGKGLPVIELFAPPTHADLCEFIQSQLAEIGIKILLQVEQPQMLRTKRERYETPFFRASWIADYADAENYLSLFYGQNGVPPNYTGFNNPLYDQWYEQAVRETDEGKRLSLYQKMDSLVMEEAVVIPLYYDEVYRFVSRGIDGMQVNAINGLDLKWIRPAKNTPQ